MESQDSSINHADVERFVRLLTTHERKLRAFLFHLVVDRDAVDEIMQDACTSLWKKFSQLENDDGFLPWAYVICRYETLMYRRKLARDRLVFDEGLIEQLANEYESHITSEAVDLRQSYLKECMTHLRENDQRLLMTAYGSKTTIIDMAEQLGTSSNALYKSLGRLRRRLKDCVRSKLVATT
ncbi:sigma-70 family RNA polymerase sigma factor [Rhodopirellula sp. JC740]|uniref:Sigma-70 family RNA polymerase sigma factor n=1 Tax=Rhodopirellula halodulae TaxID=2894198 RepID=A0ABS8NE99_9BACT|nr:MULTISPECIES: sigma-70 family RNA polymerase sigma factor [unclassified Rhodopirellula]MCC9641754.1 sigma-70 family RNA polymerase sigma factor [Rhodopirellula sp. JC740]MCC9654746.1 sigma-70 family RNA polymerase sigma factor [Rhodopirellula sp. JC737]